jgi:Putative DNA-binding domain
MWEDRRLREITEADLRQIIDVQLSEHLELDYKGALYDDNDRGHKEFLQDICMFANSGGGILLLGISEQRDVAGQPTGLPDPIAELGIEIPNTEKLLQAYDARTLAAIEERLPLESFAIPVAGNRFVVAIRVPNSMSKPHRVHYQGRTYFTSRRERDRYEMNVREIKEMMMRTASRLEDSQDRISNALENIGLGPQLNTPSIHIGIIPVFWQNFMVDVQNRDVIHAVSEFHLGFHNFLQPTYNFNGLVRQIVGHEDSFVQVGRDGSILLAKRLDLARVGGTLSIRPAAIDIILRAFVSHCSTVYAAAGITGPFLLTMLLRTPQAISGLFPSQIPGAEEQGGITLPGDYPFPVMQADSLLDIDRVIRPLCDQAHQMFGRQASPFFDADGAWIRRN